MDFTFLMRQKGITSILQLAKETELENHERVLMITTRRVPKGAESSFATALDIRMITCGSLTSIGARWRLIIICRET